MEKKTPIKAVKSINKHLNFISLAHKTSDDSKRANLEIYMVHDSMQ
jgi:hypothetical protein